MNSSEKFSRCVNGHIVPYGSDYCPWCGESIHKNQRGSAMPDNTKGMGGQPETSRTTAYMNAGTKEGSRHTMPVSPSLQSERTVVLGAENNAIAGYGGRLVGWLVSYDLKPEGAAYALHEGKEIIGRGKDSTICIDDAQLSKEHAVILFRNGRFIFEDRLSSNGSEINGKEVIGQLELHHGDTLKMGRITFVFVEVPQNGHNRNQENV